MRRVLLSCCVLCLAACHDATAVVVSITQSGLTIPDQLASVRITVDDPDDPTIAPSYVSADLPLCGTGAPNDCYALPLSVTLRPGDAQPNATVRVVVTALDQKGAQVTRDAAQFSFTNGQTSRLDFVLSPRCLDTDCATLGRTCGAVGDCESIAPTMSAQPDLGTGPTTSQPITLVFEDSSFYGGASTAVAIPTPSEIHEDDLVLVFGSMKVAPAGWTLESPVGPDANCFSHRATANEPATVAFATQEEGTFVVVAYRNVARLDVAFASESMTPIEYPSYDVAIGGTIGIDYVYTQSSVCSVQGPSDMSVQATMPTQGGVIAQWGPLPTGPTGPRTFTCSEPVGGAIQLFLVPSP